MGVQVLIKTYSSVSKGVVKCGVCGIQFLLDVINLRRIRVIP